MKLRIAIDAEIQSAVIYDEDMEHPYTLVVGLPAGTVLSRQFTESDFLRFATIIQRAHGRILASRKRGGIAAMLEAKRLKRNADRRNARSNGDSE